MNRVTSHVGVATLIILLSLIGCVPTSLKWKCPQLTNNEFQESVINNHSEPKTVSIYIDGTLSMQGFVKVVDSRYVQTLDSLDRAVTAAFRSSKVKYYRFGISTEELVGEQNSQKAQNSAFYRNDSKLKDANLSAVIEHTNRDYTDSLSIIVTDLYQKESSQETPVIKLIKENYIQKGNALGIVAVKSEFQGAIYDVGKQDKYFQWTTDNKSVEKFHPFYIILLGKYENIARYFDTFKGNKLSFMDDDKFIIYSPLLLKKPLSLNISAKENNRKLPQGINSRRSINDSRIKLQLEDSNSTDIDILKISKKSNEDSKQQVVYTVDYFLLPYTLQFEPETKSSTSEIVRSSNNVRKIDSELIKFSQWKIQDKRLSFVTDFNSIKETGVYRFVFDIFPNKLQDQIWWKTWSFDEEEAKSWIAQPNKFDGSRTYNLFPFLQGLSEITLQQIKFNKSSIGRFCYVIQKE